MYLTIKKKDSVTSILLFLFNVFLVERGITAISLNKIFRMLEPFQKNETAIRMGLSRGVQNGLLVNEKKDSEVYYRITNEAAQGFKHWQKTLAEFSAKIQFQLAEWDGEWSILFVESIGANKNAAGLVESLKQLGYGNLNNTLLISPYNLTDSTSNIASKYGMKDFYQFRGKLIRTINPKEVVNNVWPIQKLSERYMKFSKSMSEAISRLDPETYNGGGGLPYLHLYGMEFFEIIQDDPQLPVQLLPASWPGLEVPKAFLDTRQKILPKANAFIDCILTNK